MPATKRCIPVFSLSLSAGARVGWELLSMNHFSQCCTLFCPLPKVWAPLSLHERNNLKWRNTSMSPFPPLLHEWLYNWFFFPPVVPAIGAVITIYLGSLFHYSGAAVKPEEKCCVFWFMGAIWPVLIRGIYRMWCRLWKQTKTSALQSECEHGFHARWKACLSWLENKYDPVRATTFECISALRPRSKTRVVTTWFPSHLEDQREGNPMIIPNPSQETIYELSSHSP